MPAMTSGSVSLVVAVEGGAIPALASLIILLPVSVLKRSTALAEKGFAQGDHTRQKLVPAVDGGRTDAHRGRETGAEKAMRKSGGGILALVWLMAACGGATAAELRAEMHRATPSGPGEAVGTVTIADIPQGAAITTDLTGMPPGPHGFHVHENGSCQPATSNGQTVPAGAAGGHFDPQHTGKHAGPQGQGHLGDLPVLTVSHNGAATETLTAPRIKDVGALRGKALMIHAGSDTYSDQPPLGGGGARIACGVLQ